MKRIEFVGVGDLHLEKMKSVFGEDHDHIAYTFKALNQVTKYCMDNSIGTLVQLGDITDTPFPSQSTIKRFTRWCLETPYINKYFIPGNHDFSSRMDVSVDLFKEIADIAELEHTKVYIEPEEVKIEGIPFMFMPFPCTKPPKSKQPRLVFGHFTASGAKMDNGYTAHEGEDVKSGKDFYILGHLHRRQSYKKRRISYPGTLTQMTFGEPLPKGFYHYTVEWTKKKMKVSSKFIQIKPPYELHTVTALEVGDLEQLKEIRKSVKDVDVRFKLLLGPKMRLPMTFLTDNPDIVSHSGFKNKQEKDDLKADVISLTVEEAELFDPLRLLSNRLKDMKIPKEKRNRIKAIARDIMDSP